MRLLICAGGTGGGVYPALVVLQALGKDADPVLWVGGEGGMEAELVQRAGVPFTAIPAGQVAGMGLKTLPGLLKVMQGTLASRRILNDFKPDVLLFTGGFVAVPMALAASGWLGKRIPSLVYVPDIEPGLALKLLARFASLLGLTTESSQAYFPAGKRSVVTGYPTRPELEEWTREKAHNYLHLQPGRFTLLVTGGSKGARTLNQPFFQVLPALLDEMQVVHITGKNDWEEAQAVREALPPAQARHYHAMPYLHEMGAALAAADLAVSRAGASILGEYPLFGLPSILVPYPYAWRYQIVNANYLVERGGAVLVETAQLPEKLLPTIRQLAEDRGRLQRMRQSMQALAKPRADLRLAELVRELALKPSADHRERKHG